MSDLRDRRRDSIREYLAALDQGDLAGALAATDENLEFRFANAAPQTGRDAVAAVGQKLSLVVTSVQHEIKTIHLTESSSYGTAELDITYEQSEQTLRVPACVVFGFDDHDLISECRIYQDVSALGVDTGQW